MGSGSGSVSASSAGSGSVSNEYGSEALVAILWLSHGNSYCCVCLLGKVGRICCGQLIQTEARNLALIYWRTMRSMPLYGKNLLRRQLLHGTLKAYRIAEESNEKIRCPLYLSFWGWLVMEWSLSFRSLFAHSKLAPLSHVCTLK